MIAEVMKRIRARCDGVPCGPEATEALYEPVGMLARDTIERTFYRVMVAARLAEEAGAELNRTGELLLECFAKSLGEQGGAPGEFSSKVEAIIINECEWHVRGLLDRYVGGGNA